MPEQEPFNSAPRQGAAWAALPVWSRAFCASLVLHVVALFSLGVAVTDVHRGAGAKVGREVPISLESRLAAPDVGEQDSQITVSPSLSDSLERESGSAADAAALEGPLAADLSFLSKLPTLDSRGTSRAHGAQRLDLSGLLGEGDSHSGQPDSADGKEGGRGAAGGGLAGVLAAGRARTSVFGIAAEGYKFAYVFDRSGSMGGSGFSPLAAAKAELRASLDTLGDLHQFQIIFYNERPTTFALAGRPGRLIFGTKANKDRAANFIDGITADGGTGHEAALLAALKIGADVIFFLTDADQPELRTEQLENIHTRNGGRSMIHSIEFGLGPQLNPDNFLARLARQNGGEYTYFDITRLEGR